jgi:hypothetical protein
MEKDSKIISITLVILLGVLLQVMLIFADIKDTPNEAAVEFTKAYLKYDKDGMAARMCADQQTVDDVNVIDAYVYNASVEADQRGYSLCWLSDRLAHYDTHIVEKGNDKAVVTLEGLRRAPIRAFFTKEQEHIHETFELVKEDGKWKVCNPVFSLSEG